MSKNIYQVYTTNPITTNASTDLMYFGQSPYGSGNDAAMTYANFAAQFGTPYTPAALTSTNDTNVTITLGGTPSTALLEATSLTLGWTGQLAVSRGGTGSSSFSSGSVIYSNGTILTQDNANFNWNDTNYTLAITQPSTLATLESVLIVTSDPSGSHGHGNHIQIAGNPNGGGTIFRTGTVANDSWIQITGGDHTTTGGGTIYLNGNAASESGAEGCVQTTFGLSTSSFQMYDYTQSSLLFQLNNAGILQLPNLNANSALSTDASHNVTAIASATAGYVLTSNGAGSAPTFQATSSGSITIDSDNGSATGSTITFTAVNGDNNSGSTVNFSASGSTVVLNVTDSNENTLFGLNSGNNTQSGSNNAAFGWNTLLGLTGGAGNTAIGAQALQALQSGSDNVAVGYESLFTSTADTNNVGVGTFALYLLNGGSNNVSIGYNTGADLLTGSSNLLLGTSSGSSYGSSESNNICLNTNGVETPGENNVLRIGAGTGSSTGQLNSAYINGIYSNSQPASATVEYVTIDNTTGLLGVTTSASGGITWTSPSSSESMVSSNGYFTRGLSQVVMTLPITASAGDTFIISNTSAAGFMIAQNSGQYINYGNLTTTTGTGGNITSTAIGDTLTIVCSVPNTGFQVVSAIGELNVT